jgi:hypothetical protein
MPPGTTPIIQYEMKRAPTAVLLLIVLVPHGVLALDCPSMPEQTKADWGTEVEAAVGRIGPVKGAELAVKTKTATLNLFDRMPEADRVYLEQMMYAAYCSALRADMTMLESEKASLIRTYNKEVRNAISQRTSTTPSSAPPNPKSAPPPASAPEEHRPSPRGKDHSAAAGLQTGNPATSDTQGVPPKSTPLNFDATTTLELVILGRDPADSANFKEFHWQSQLRWGEIFEIVYPYLVAHPYDGVVRSNLAQAIADKYMPTNIRVVAVGDPRLKEHSFQDVSVELRSHDLVKVEYLAASSGGSALFLGAGF